ncbi:interleukin-1 receptor accessory protein [Amia ocellicauda]|uniref:interleukin-1 receptor accessory protein n=1 Tax=Amia ocellicauda TaxID=2972642 RepID=UPI003464C853
MGLFWFMLPLLFAVPEAIPSGTSEPGQRHPSDHCHDWGIFLETVQVYDGEAGILKCPLFSEKGRYNYSSAQAAGLTLVWYWIRDGQDLEKPIDFRLQRISKLKERLWFQPAVLNDTGNYICMLRNSTYCFKVMVPLIVLQKDPGTCINARFKSVMKTAPIEKIVELVCPDFEDFLPTPHSYTVNWYYNCVNNFGPAGFTDREVKGNKVIIYIMREAYAGNYTCVVNYTVNGKPATLTRTITVKVVGRDHKELPMIHNPNENEENIVTLGEDLDLTCRVQFYYMEDSDSEVWWSLNGKKVEPYTNTRFRIISSTTENLEYNIIVKTLRIEKFNSGDLKGDFTCFARNALGEKSSKAIVKPKAYVPSVELGCGLGFILFLMIVLIVVYHVYWLELVLLYRAHFGTDESLADGKEYDIYISYARNTEEEEFVLLTLREVLENDLGYKVCIFDRDSLPGGTITDETLSFIWRSRRVIIVLSPNYVLQGTQALLELKAGIHNMALAGNLRVILVQYKPVKKVDYVKELKRARVALTLIRWNGEKSKDLSARFWKQLQVQLPTKKIRDSADCSRCSQRLLKESSPTLWNRKSGNTH